MALFQVWSDSAKFLPCMIKTTQIFFEAHPLQKLYSSRMCYELSSTSEQQVYRPRIHLSSTSKSSLSSNFCMHLHTLPSISMHYIRLYKFNIGKPQVNLSSICFAYLKHSQTVWLVRSMVPSPNFLGIPGPGCAAAASCRSSYLHNCGFASNTLQNHEHLEILIGFCHET